MAGASFFWAAAGTQSSRAKVIAGGVWWFIALEKEVDSFGKSYGPGETKYQSGSGWGQIEAMDGDHTTATAHLPGIVTVVGVTVAAVADLEMWTGVRGS